MKGQPKYPTTPGALKPEHWVVPIRVRLVPYVEFGHWLDAELEKLVQRWQDKAAPCARRARSTRLGSPKAR